MQEAARRDPGPEGPPVRATRRGGAGSSCAHGHLPDGPTLPQPEKARMQARLAQPKIERVGPAKLKNDHKVSKMNEIDSMF